LILGPGALHRGFFCLKFKTRVCYHVAVRSSRSGGYMKITLKLVVVALTAVASIFSVVDVSAQAAGRISGTVTTPDGTPIEGVKITISAETLNRDIVKTTNKKGKFTVAHSDATADYRYKFEKEGYQTMVLPVNPPVGGTQVRQFPMMPVAAGPAQGGDAPAGGAPSGGANPAIRAYNEGVEAQRLGDYDLAAESFRKAAKIDSKLAAARTALAAVALSQEDYSTAAAEAEAALEIDPEDVRAMQLRFDAYRNLGDEAKVSEAAAALRKIGDLEAAAARLFNEGVDAYAAGDIAMAQSKFQQVVQLSPDMVAPYIALAQISLAQGSAAEALAMAQSALEREPDDTRALKIAFDGARLTGNNEAAAQALDRLIELEPQWVTTTLFEHAVKLFNNNQPEEAALELRSVLQADPDHARANYLLGMALFNSGRADEGRGYLEKFVGLTPDDPDAEIARGLLSYQQ
jgi:tetratricopeptide (TPR) repeat protein